MKQLKEPEEFTREVAYLYEHKDEKSRDEIEFADGRYFDSYSSSLCGADGKYYGRIWYFRDITGRKHVEEKLRDSYGRLRRTLEETASALASALEKRDQYTAGHQNRVSQLACAIAQEMGMTEEQIEGLRIAGILHDIGKLNIPAEILSKPGKLGNMLKCL